MQSKISKKDQNTLFHDDDDDDESLMIQARGDLGETLRPPKVFALKSFSAHWPVCLDHGKVMLASTF